MNWLKRLFRVQDSKEVAFRLGLINADDLWVLRHHVPNPDVSFVCKGPVCTHSYCPSYASLIGFRCHECHRLLWIISN